MNSEKLREQWLAEEAIAVNYHTALIFAVFGSVYILNIVLTTIANGLGKLKTQIYFYGIGACLKIPICLLLREIGIGWHGIVIYNSVILLIFCVCQYIWTNRLLGLLSHKCAEESHD